MATSISHADIVRLAELSRIELSSDEMGVLEHDLGSILTYVSELSSLTDIDGIDRTYNSNTLRLDEHPHESSAHSTALLAEVPKTDREYIVVKQIITKRDDH
jgi:aspartyl/glutamyl-tRNA(Asn/Gln) amidotransferase C subunit